MNLRRWLSAGASVAFLSVATVAAYQTHDRWLPHVFPKAPVSDTGTAPPVESDHGHDAHDRVKLSIQAQKNLALVVDTPTPQEYWRTILIPGTVVDRPGESDRGVTSRVAGIISVVHAKPGDTVRGGDPLFEMQLASEYLQSTQTDLVKSARELEISTARRDRIAEQVQKGTQSGMVLIDEENQVKRFTTQVQAYRRQLVLFGLSAEQVNQAERGEIITHVTVTTPGTTEAIYELQELKVNLGDQVQAGQSLAVLANHQKLYVEGRAFKSEAHALARAIERRVPIRAEFADESPGIWKPQEPLMIRHLSNQVDPVSRTFGFYLSLDNQPRFIQSEKTTHFVWRYRPGQRVRLYVPIEPLTTRSKDGSQTLLPFVFPAGAVVREGPEAYVFVQSGDMFIRKTVHVLYEDRSDVVIANDGSITEADYVVHNQAAAINRALKSSESDGGHGHDHDH